MARANRHHVLGQIQSPPKRYRLINREQLLVCCPVGSDAGLVACHREWIEETINGPHNVHQP